MLLLVLAQAAALAACPEASSNESLLGTLITAERAYGQGDVSAFNSRIRAARAALPCLDELARPDLVAAWHRSGALEPLVVPEASDRPVVLASLRALLAVQPDYVFPTALAPQGSVLPVWLGEARDAGPGELVDVLTPARTTLYFDGQQGAARPASRPVILQLQWEGEPGVRYTAALDPGEPLPDWQALGLLPPTPVAEAPAQLGRRGTMALGGGALALTASAGVFLGIGLANRAEFMALEEPDRTEQLIARSHALSLASLGSALGAAGLGLVVLNFGTR